MALVRLTIIRCSIDDVLSIESIHHCLDPKFKCFAQARQMTQDAKQKVSGAAEAAKVLSLEA